MATANVVFKITADSAPARYGFWFAKASIRVASGTPTPFHQIMVNAGLWKRRFVPPNALNKWSPRFCGDPSR
jgi:hypothetical protein